MVARRDTGEDGLCHVATLSPRGGSYDATMSRERSATGAQRGSSLLGLLLVLLVLGVMAAVAVSSLGGGGVATLPTTPLVTSTSTGEPVNVALQASLTASCVADFQTLTTALQVYSALHNADPPAGISWASGIESGSTLVASWPSDPGHFTLTWNGKELGVAPVHGTASVGSPGAARDANGCYATLG